ncbi:hypothetical protein KFZ76_01310 [Methylovulum psychrotolerans]|uniref:GIY-YIG nuclease family protein n=1 Tax=Methylovulum psychrotolerans TaxID=1704499 RepID=UPI001BFF1A4B|nr:GIY-YIG nuclease family protein [Methylovulum psychrotolerans]MBT9096347.1 hypothetical protein [Methylovulum psychrotolerans]
MGIQVDTLNSAKTEAINKLNDLSRELAAFSFPEIKIVSFNVNNFSVDHVISQISKILARNDYIYIFKTCGQNRDNRKFRNELLKAKKTQEKGEKDFPKVNEANKGTQYLYVGRSHKLKNRIRQHLDDGYKGTYAMHMKRWCDSLNETVEILYFELEDKDNLLVQAVEDALWDKLRPCFGRKGDK